MFILQWKTCQWATRVACTNSGWKTEVTNICTSASFPRCGKYSQVTDFCQISQFWNVAQNSLLLLFCGIGGGGGGGGKWWYYHILGSRRRHILTYQHCYAHWHKSARNIQNTRLSKKKGNCESSDCALDVIVWVRVSAILQSALTPIACYAAFANPWTETV